MYIAYNNEYEIWGWGETAADASAMAIELSESDDDRFFAIVAATPELVDRAQWFFVDGNSWRINRGIAILN
jgi:hypothetical protein